MKHRAARQEREKTYAEEVMQLSGLPQGNRGRGQVLSQAQGHRSGAIQGVQAAENEG